MKISEVMTRRPFVVEGSRRVGDVLSVARDRGVEHILICDHGEIVGLACAECDLGEARLDSEIWQYMGPMLTVEEGASLEEAANQMLRRDTGAVIVSSGRGVVGIATRGDLVRGGLSCNDDMLARFFCASCGAHAHVHADPHTEWLAYCSSCSDRASAPELTDDLGGGD